MNIYVQTVLYLDMLILLQDWNVIQMSRSVDWLGYTVINPYAGIFKKHALNLRSIDLFTAGIGIIGKKQADSN